MFHCKRCGKCCKEIGREMWRQPDIREKIKNDLYDALVKYKKTSRGECLMLGYEGAKAVCILEKVFGVKPKLCSMWPCDELNSYCYQENNISNKEKL